MLKSHFNLYSFLCLALISTTHLQAFSASCCGGGFAAPSVITSDDKAQLTSTVSYNTVDTDVFANGIWQKRRGTDSTQIYRIEGSHIIGDVYQVGFSIPVQIRERDGVAGGTTAGLADVSGQVGYEYLPDWNYNPWRPKGVGFLTVTLPTGQSIYESDDGLNSRGRGFFALGAGTILTKNWLAFDANTTFEMHYSFPKVVSGEQFRGNVTPGMGYSGGFGVGYNIGQTRIGSSLTWYYEDPVNVDGTIVSNGSEQRYTTGIFSLSQMFGTNWATTLSYLDQTIFGEPTNTTLSKGFSLSIQKRWAR